MRRKNIALLTALPESVHGQRIIRGMAVQCEKYGYNAAVFGAMTHIQIPRYGYTVGEINIFNLMRCENLDGVILDISTLQGDMSGENLKRIRERLEQDRNIPVVALEIPFADYPLVQNRNEQILREMVRHVIEVHGKKKLCILTGQKDNGTAESRLAIFLDEIHRHGLTVADEHIVYGDFWYFSGDTLAQSLLNGDISMPEAVICASDHMAIGLIDRLQKNGVRIPEDLIVIGMEATEEGATNRIPLSSFEANDAGSAADAVDAIRRIIEPDAPILPYDADPNRLFHPGLSCGCETDPIRTAEVMRSAMYHTSHNYESEGLTNNIDIGVLMESYMLEQVTGCDTPEDCLSNIHSCTYLILPYVNCFLCLREDWMYAERDTEVGYPERMKIVFANSDIDELSFCDEKNGIEFDTKLMIPRMHEDSAEPSVFYFSPVHFNEKMLGYFVLQRRINDTHYINLVYRNWLRFVNNALEMSRAKKRLLMLSARDEMTGAYNRRGMYQEIERMRMDADPNSTVFVGVIDMDGLKYINDTFGHSEGDFGLRTISTAVASVTRENEICVRAGGDEFYVIGIGRYAADAPERRTAAFNNVLDALAKTYSKPYTVTASIGCVTAKLADVINIDELICLADEVMYRAKVARKRQRIN